MVFNEGDDCQVLVIVVLRKITLILRNYRFALF